MKPLSNPPTFLQVQAEMTHPQFQKWFGCLQTNQSHTITTLAAQLYHFCDGTLEHNIVNKVSNFFTLNENDILQTLKSIVSKHSNPAVYHLNFSNLYQHEHKSVKDYRIQLKTYAMDCKFSCLNCSHDLLTTHVKDQFIRGVHNDVLQTGTLAKAS